MTIKITKTTRSMMMTRTRRTTSIITTAGITTETITTATIRMARITMMTITTTIITTMTLLQSELRWRRVHDIVGIVTERLLVRNGNERDPEPIAGNGGILAKLTIVGHKGQAWLFYKRIVLCRTGGNRSQIVVNVRLANSIFFIWLCDVRRLNFDYRALTVEFWSSSFDRRVLVVEFWMSSFDVMKKSTIDLDTFPRDFTLQFNPLSME